MQDTGSENISQIILESVSKIYFQLNDGVNNSVEVLKDFNLSVKKNELLTIFGPNGCGKSTILQIIAGLTSYDFGTVKINEKSPLECEIGYVFQNFQDSLFPWRTVIDNIAFPLELKGLKKERRHKQSLDLLEYLGIDFNKTQLQSYPYQLSGGQQQLVAISRSLINDPEVLLLDEPFNQLDFQTRISIIDKVLDIWQRKKITIVFVSHDIEEAIIMGDRTALLSKRPAKVKEMMENQLPRPRNHAVVQTINFFSLKNHALEVIGEELNI